MSECDKTYEGHDSYEARRMIVIDNERLRNEITILRSQLAEAKADNARLREALESCFPMAAAWATQYAQSYLGIDNPDPSDWAAEHVEAIQAARQALADTEPSK